LHCCNIGYVGCDCDVGTPVGGNVVGHVATRTRFDGSGAFCLPLQPAVDVFNGMCDDDSWHNDPLRVAVCGLVGPTVLHQRRLLRGRDEVAQATFPHTRAVERDLRGEVWPMSQPSPKDRLTASRAAPHSGLPRSSTPTRDKPPAPR